MKKFSASQRLRVGQCMKFSENWLRTFVNPPLASADLAGAAHHVGGGSRGAGARRAVFDKVVWRKCCR